MEVSIQLKLSLILLAALSSFLLGGLWYGPLFDKAWQRSLGAAADGLDSRSMGKVFGFAFLLAVVTATTLSAFLGPEPELVNGVVIGFSAGLGGFVPLLGTLYLFEARPFSALLINGG